MKTKTKTVTKRRFVTPSEIRAAKRYRSKYGETISKIAKRLRRTKSAVHGMIHSRVAGTAAK